MKKLILLFVLFASFQAYSQHNLTVKRLTTDTIRARVDSIYFVSPVSGLNIDLSLNGLSDVDTTGLDSGEALVWDGLKWINDSIQSVSLGTTNQIPFINAGNTDFNYSANLIYDGDTLKVPYLNASDDLKIRDTTIIDLIQEYATASPAGNNQEIQFNNNGAFGSDVNLKWNGTYLDLSDPSNTNSFIGKNNGLNITTASKNSTLGVYSGNKLTSGQNNTFIGYYAGSSVMTSSSNTFLGFESGKVNSGGCSNTFTGAQSGWSNTTGHSNVYLGMQAGYSGVSSYQNVILGFNAGRSNTTNTQVFVGSEAGRSNATGTSNTFIGYRSGYSNLTGQQNTFLGYEAGYANTNSYNTFIGHKAGRSNLSGNYNVFVGRDAGINNSTGIGITIVGDAAGQGMTNKNYNTIIGVSAASAANGDYNTVIGATAMMNGTTNAKNTIIGYNSGRDATGNSNVFLGYYSGYYETGSNKLFIDNQSRTNEATSRTSSLIYGEFNATVSSQLFRVNGVMEGIKRCAKFHRIDSINTSTINSWVNVKLDTLIAEESTSGFTFNADSTGIITDFTGIVRVQGCLHFDWNGAAGTQVSIYARVTVNGVESRCLQANLTRSNSSGDYMTLPFAGTLDCEPTNVVRLQYRVSNTDMDLQGDPVFDNPIAASINFEQIGIKR